LDADTLESLKVTELRSKCRERDLYAKGLKRELVSRLREYLVEKAKRLEQQQQKSSKTEETESNDIFPDATGEDDDDDVIVEEPEKPTEQEGAEKMEEEEQETEKPPEAMETEEKEEANPEENATEEPATGEPAEAMEVETPAQEEEADDQEVELALIDVGTVADKLSGICAIINQVQNEGSAYWFVPDLTSVDSWAGSEEELKAYTEKIEKPMSFTQVKAQIEDGTLDTEEKVVEAVLLIFKNAKEFNEEGSEWYVNACDVEKHFQGLKENLDAERKMTELDENGKLKFAELPVDMLKKLIEQAELKVADDATDEAMRKLAEEAVGKLEEKAEDFDVKQLVLTLHRGPQEEPQEPPESKNNAFYVAIGFNHELRQIHHDRDIISSSQTDKTRMLIFEFRKDISSKLDSIKSNWLKLMKEGPAKGIEKKSVFGEDGAQFEELMTKLVASSNQYYKKEKKFATTEELIISNKKLRSDKESLEKKLKARTEENRQLKKILEEVGRLSAKAKKFSSTRI